MNFLFLTQNGNLSVFYEVAKILRKTRGDQVGFYVADSISFETFQKNNPEILLPDVPILKEWEILQKARKTKADINKLKSYEKKLGDPALWNAILADRRLYLGPHATLEQCNDSRYSHDELLSILQVGVEEIEALFDRFKPDAVIGYVCVTIGEYLSIAVARSRNIPVINLRPTRIENFYHAADHVSEPSHSTQEIYHHLLKTGLPKNLEERVSQYLAKVRGEHAMYDGVIPVSTEKEKTIKAKKRKSRGLVYRILGIIQKYYQHHFGIYQHDNHYYGIFYPYWCKKVKYPLRKEVMRLLLKSRYLGEEALEKTEYAFYPLHKEPEVTLLIYSRPYLNQIEAIKNIARSLPVGMKLVVKEHPAAIGYRPVSYYKALLKIPNVCLADPQITSRVLVQNSRLVTVIGGSVALEALMLKKPVVALGNAPFIFLPEKMMKKIENPDSLASHIRDLLENHTHDESALKAYIAAVMETSVAVNFYSELLGKGGFVANKTDSSNEKKKRDDLHRLTQYFLSRTETEKPFADVASL